MTDRGRMLLSGWCVLVVFLGAFLLFQIQPIISKRILPWFGGAPAVWTTCMLFFQVALLGGYFYAHLSARWAARGWSLYLHAAILAVAIFLPVNPADVWKPNGSDLPTGRILALLIVHVGLQYFLLASTAPLAQTWFVTLFQNRSPYRLYVVSNAASLLALLTYPFVFEPLIGVSRQGDLWWWCFVAFAASSGGLALVVASRRAPISPGSVPAAPSSDAPYSIGRVWLVWLLLPALASMLLLAVTNRLSQDVAVTPLLWVTPLAVYLVSFIICFDNDRWYRRLGMGLSGAASVIAVCFLLRAVYVDIFLEGMGLPWRFFGIAARFSVESTVFLFMLFLLCMVCHGETVRHRPPPRYLTVFYLTIAAGGALGGVLVSLVCPLIFSSYLELNLSLTLGFFLCGFVIFDQGKQRGFWSVSWRRTAALAAFGLAATLVIFAQIDALDSRSLVARRSFYGVLRLEHLDKGRPSENISLWNGRILHGFQWLDPAKSSLPTSYYDANSGVGLLLSKKPGDRRRRMGVLGLGVGTLAAYGKPGDYFCFYEINPDVYELASQHFTYLRHSQAETAVVVGDARLVMERQPPQNYDVLVLDAFSSDAVPMHLLTLEAFDIYLRHLVDDGVIAAHLSNRHLDLSSVVRRIGKERGLDCVAVTAAQLNHLADWMFLSRDPRSLEMEWLKPFREAPADAHLGPLWTDDRSDLIQIMK